MPTPRMPQDVATTNSSSNLVLSAWPKSRKFMKSPAPTRISTNRRAHDAELPSFSDRIKLLIKACGSVTQVARTCGFSEGVVRSWRDGRSDPSRERCLTLARGLGVSLLWLIAGEGAMWDDAEANPTVTAREITADSDASSKVSAGSKVMDANRLSAAVRMLQSTLELTDSGLTVSDAPDLLGEIYALMGLSDPLKRAEGLSQVHTKIAERVRAHREQQSS
ncbi:helix-turn-helix transcriptional regulator [Oleiagrimonas sp. C23AA]|uniref:helix-turn-helix domain-containing protein n=1 Tax=Oleiagrimonas sp. C23AA TaxID=2719047 RepID=UPI00141E90B0|nr:helix-turn-helix transcriptional regulator [Oleiagrimonas sp. C23AA]NII12220.1 helix-turn-helix transcriptional regulator [Oleiagrimonas sp. C23AA]